MLKFFRSSVGIYNELRRLRELVEWYMEHHPSMENIGLPPTSEAIASAEKDHIEALASPEEEEVAEQAAVDLLRRRAKGLKEDNPDIDDWDMFT